MSDANDELALLHLSLNHSDHVSPSIDPSVRRADQALVQVDRGSVVDIVVEPYFVDFVTLFSGW